MTYVRTNPYPEEGDFDDLMSGPKFKKPRTRWTYVGTLIGLAILAAALAIPNPLSPF
jgi:hypothetical protein